MKKAMCISWKYYANNSLWGEYTKYFVCFSFVSVLTRTLTSGCICKWIWSIGETKIDDTKGIYFIHCFLNYDSCIYIQKFFCDMHLIYVYGKKDLDGMLMVTSDIAD